MSNKKRIKKRISKIESNLFQKFIFQLNSNANNAEIAAQSFINFLTIKKELGEWFKNHASDAMLFSLVPGIVSSLKSVDEIQQQKFLLQTNIGTTEAKEYYNKIVAESYQEHIANSQYIFQKLFLKNKEFNN